MSVTLCYAFFMQKFFEIKINYDIMIEKGV